MTTAGESAAASQVRAAVIDRPGAEPRITEIRLPARSPGRTLIDVLAASLNPLDIGVAAGAVPSLRSEDPYVPGIECAGTVLASDQHAVGALVYAEAHPSADRAGCFATRVLVNDADVLPIPADIDPALAVAVGNSGVAAYLSLLKVAGLQPGDNVLILGATGVVGQLAVQIARQHSAGQITCVGRDHAALDALKDLGADALVALNPDEAPERIAARLTAAGARPDVVLDALFGRPVQAALRVCSARARIVNIGNADAQQAVITAGLLRAGQISITGFASVLTPMADKRTALEWMWAAAARGDLTVPLDVRPLSELPAAWRAQQTSPHVKIVIDPRHANGRDPAN